MNKKKRKRNPKVKLTDAEILKMKPYKDRDRYIPDADIPGLRMRITPNGAKRWIWTYAPRDGSQTRTHTLGAFPEIKVDEARSLVAGFRKKVRVGDDPHAELAATRKRARMPLSALLSRYTEARKADGLSRKTMEAYRQLWLWTKPLHDREVNAIKRAEIAALIGTFAGKKTAGNRVLIYLRQVYRWAALLDYVRVDPTLGLKRKKETPRERALSIAEIDTLLRFVWKSFDWPIRLGIYLLLVTGQRVSECLDMEWEELDFQWGSDEDPNHQLVIIADWRIPAQRRKVRADHLVPLPHLVAKRILTMTAALSEEALSSGIAYVDYHSHRVGAGMIPKGVSGRVLTIRSGGRERWQRKIREGLAKAGINDFQLRDLRRTATTEGFARFGAEAQTISRLLGHVGHAGARQTAVYDRNARIEESRIAIQKWSERVEVLIRSVELGAGRAS